MTYIYKYITLFLQKISSCGLNPDDSPEIRVKKRLLCGLSFLISIAGVFWSLFYFCMGMHISAIFPVLYSCIVSLSLYFFRRNKNFRRFLYIQLSLILLLPFTLQWSLGGFSQSGVVMVWAILCPFGSLVFDEPKKSWVWFFSYVGLTITSVIQDLYFPGPSPEKYIVLIFFSMNILTVSLFSFLAMYYFVALSREELSKQVLIEKQSYIITQKENLVRSYSRFVPSEFLSLLNKESILDIQFGDSMNDRMTVLFSDIRGFTTLSETMESNALFDFLNSYLSLASPIIKKNDGFIDKFIGDAIMAIFPQSPLNALYAAVELVRELKKYNQSIETGMKQTIRVGIGMHYGSMTLGTIGSSERMDTTVIGDAVNLASRLESLTKVFHVPIIISESFYEKIPKEDTIFIREIDIVKIKGKLEPIRVFEAFGFDEPEIIQKKKSIEKKLQEAIQLFRKEDFSSAKKLFIECQKEVPEDSIPVVYINRCESIKMEKQNTIRSFDEWKFKRKSILVVDDNIAVLDLMDNILRKNKFDVIRAGSGKEAIYKYDIFSPESILTDLYMPDMDGFEVIEEINRIARKRFENPKICFVSSEDSPEFREKLIKSNYVLLPKPIDVQLLLSILK